MPPEAPEQGRTVLVVDDDVDTRALLRLALEDEGFTVDSAGDGLSALQKIRHKTPDAIILDLNMPRMGGEDFLYAWRAGVEAPDVPVIVVSAAYKTLTPEDLGVDVFLPKPFDLPALIEHVRRLVEKSHRAPMAPAPNVRDPDLHEVLDSLAHQLSAVLGCVELLAEDEAIPDHLRALSVMAVENAQRASATMRQLRRLTDVGEHATE